MRILMVAACPLPWPRGTPIRIHRMAEALARRGHEVHVATYPAGDDTTPIPYHIHRIARGKRRLDPRPGPSTRKLLYLDPLVAIPLHGVIQLMSNSSRATIQRAHLSWGIVARFSILLLPAGFLGITLAQGLPSEGIRMAIGAFVLAATWAPGLFKLPVPEGDTMPTHRFTVLGGIAGTLNTTIGATGPLIAPFYLGLGLTRRFMIGHRLGRVLQRVKRLLSNVYSLSVAMIKGMFDSKRHELVSFDIFDTLLFKYV